MKIAIIGYGVEGRSSLNWMQRHHPEAQIVIFDQNTIEDIPDGVEFQHVADFMTQDFSSYDMLIRSPGIRPDAINAPPDKITSITKIFCDRCPAPIIGVTGTKGKGTTCSFIYEILIAAGLRAHLVGNIGVPALDVLDDVQPDDVVVYEMSNFQLFDMHRSPHIAVVIHLEIDHQDFHDTPIEYFDAKKNIARYQKSEDTLIYDGRNPIDLEFAAVSKAAHKVPYPITTSTEGFTREEMDELVGHIVIPGEHNRWNAEAAVLAASQYTQDRDAIRKGLANFTGLPHRLKFVREINGIRYYDDSISTTVGSAIAAMKAFAPPVTLILGGASKGVNFDSLARSVNDHSVHHVVLIGPEGTTRIKAALIAAGYNRYSELPTYTMTDVVAEANKHTTEGGVVVLSPACSSFDAFANYSERGEQFVAAVDALS